MIDDAVNLHLFVACMSPVILNEASMMSCFRDKNLPCSGTLPAPHCMLSVLQCNGMTVIKGEFCFNFWSGSLDLVN